MLSAWGAGGQVKDRDDEVRTWWKRKAACMLEGGTSMIPFTIILLGHFFEAEGARVRYAAATDNDPTLAAYANLDDAAVLRWSCGARPRACHVPCVCVCGGGGGARAAGVCAASDVAA